MEISDKVRRLAALSEEVAAELLEKADPQPYRRMAAIVAYGASQAAVKITATQRCPTGRKDDCAKLLGVNPRTYSDFPEGRGMFQVSDLD